MLNQVLADVRNKGYDAVEAFACTGSEGAPVSPLGFYLKHDFIVKKRTDEFPLVRKVLR